MRLLRLPGVFRPRSDTWMLAREAARCLGGADEVLELCTGSGAVALELAAAGARVTAVDISRRSVLTVRLNALLRRVRVRALRGSLFEPVSGERFDLVVTTHPMYPYPRTSYRTAAPAGPGMQALTAVR